MQRKAETVKPGHVFAAVVCLGHVALHIVVVASVKFFGFVRFAHKRFDDAVAFDVFLDHRIHFGERVSDIEEQGSCMLRQTACQNEQWWRDASERKSKSPINRKHHGERADEHDHAVKRLQAHPAQCVADGVGVGRHAAHDVASASVVEVGEVKFVEFFEFVADETIDGVLSEAFHPHLAAVTGADTHHGEHEHHDAQSGQFVHMALGDDAVHDQSGQQRDGEGHGVVHAEQYDRAGHARQVGFAVRQDPCKVARLLVAFRIDIHT